jgi:hypothetical protein
MAITTLLLAAASVAIPTDTFGGELVRKYQKLKTTFSSYNWE